MYSFDSAMIFAFKNSDCDFLSFICIWIKYIPQTKLRTISITPSRWELSRGSFHLALLEFARSPVIFDGTNTQTILFGDSSPFSKGLLRTRTTSRGTSMTKKPRLNSNFFRASKPHNWRNLTTPFDWRLPWRRNISAPILSTILYRSLLIIFQLIFIILFSIVSMLIFPPTQTEF